MNALLSATGTQLMGWSPIDRRSEGISVIVSGKSPRTGLLARFDGIRPANPKVRH